MNSRAHEGTVLAPGMRTPVSHESATSSRSCRLLLKTSTSRDVSVYATIVAFFRPGNISSDKACFAKITILNPTLPDRRFSGHRGTIRGRSHAGRADTLPREKFCWRPAKLAGLILLKKVIFQKKPFLREFFSGVGSISTGEKTVKNHVFRLSSDCQSGHFTRTSLYWSLIGTGSPSQGVTGHTGSYSCPAPTTRSRRPRREACTRSAGARSARAGSGARARGG